jgi:hypothetical protein
LFKVGLSGALVDEGDWLRDSIGASAAWRRARRLLSAYTPSSYTIRLARPTPGTLDRDDDFHGL